MKSEISTQRNERNYPGLYTDEDGMILFMTGPSEGMVVNTGDQTIYELGNYDRSWADEDFQPCMSGFQVVLTQ